LSENPTPEPLKPDTEEEIAELRRRLEASDAIIRNRNQEIAALQSRLAGKDEIITEAQEQIARLESDMSYVLLKVSEDKKSATIGAELPEIEAADLLNKLKGARKKSKADLADIEAILEILDK
jgi:predicted nucleotide-binding protein (sugar kinase/HSP70/actin superfamily)